MALIAGAMAGAGEAGVATGLQLQKQFGEQDLLKMRAEAEEALARTTSQLRIGEHAAGIEQDIAAIPRRQAAELPGKVSEAKAVPQKLAAGESLTEGGRITVTAPSPKETAGFYAAYADLMKARADEIRAGTKGANVPKVTKETNEDGTQHYLLDQNSGAVGRIVPGQPAKDAISHWFRADEPAKAAVPDVVQWSLNGKPLKNGLSDLYPTLGKRGGGVSDASTGGGAATPGVAAPPAAAIAALQKDPTLANDFDAKYGSGAAAKYAKPSAAAPKPESTPAKGMVNKQTDLDSLIKGGRGGIHIEVPTAAHYTSPYASLNNKTFVTREEARAALEALTPK